MRAAEVGETPLLEARRPGVTFAATEVSRVLRELSDGAKVAPKRRWLQAVASRVTNARPDLAGALHDVLGVEPAETDPLRGLTIGEIGVCYEALLAERGPVERRSSGQFFTPDDAAQFMASRSRAFGDGVWLDPCCGVGNLAWHLANLQPDPGKFVSSSLVLIDIDDVALRSAIALIAAEFAAPYDVQTVRRLRERAQRRDFLSAKHLPEHDFAILNPPYARAPLDKRFQTASCRDLFAYFIERVAGSSRGYIAVTPASYLSAPKFQPLRSEMERRGKGGDVYVFDNVPDTLFRGYKFGSSNTSKTNFVRAAITVCAPDADSWRITPIIRWKTAVRATMFEQCHRLLAPLRRSRNGEWAKLSPGQARIWDSLAHVRLTLADLVVKEPTPFSLHVATTPRYFISAAFRELDRTTKVTLYFATADDRDRAAVVLNSSVPYLWWRALDGGVTLPKRVLMSVPIPDVPIGGRLISTLRRSEKENVVVKLNAGRINENVKHPKSLVDRLNGLIIPGAEDLDLLYSNNMFPLA